MKIVSFFSFCFLPFAVFSQDFTYSKSSIITSKSPIKISTSQITRDFKPNLINLEMPEPGGNSYQSFLLRQKELIRTHAYRKTGGTVNLGDAENPMVLNGLAGNPADGSAPTDNHLAVSNNGKLISVVNSNIFIYDAEADSLLKTVSLEAFFDTLNLPANNYDPRVVYDPKQDRFIIICLNGTADSTSHIFLAFSTSNDPMDEWNLYALPGNYLNNATWSDYPIVALTDEELFITVNALDNDTLGGPERWKYLFRESIIWQITKLRGYDGDSLQTRYYNNILHGGNPVRNLCPVQGGSSTYGPNLYLLSNRNFDIENDTIFIMEVTGVLDNLQTQLTLDVKKSNTTYGLAPDAKQAASRRLLTNDSRVLAGYIEDDEIHFVQNTVNPDTPRAAIYHGIITSVSSAKNVSGEIIGDAKMDFGYPVISYTGKYYGDNEAVITFNHTSADTFAGVSAVFYDGSIGYSERVTLKNGLNRLESSLIKSRWGDYSGSQRKYDEAGKAWISGSFGGANREYLTWISEISSPDTSFQPPSSISSVVSYDSKSYPNPTSDIFSIEFELAVDKFLDISLYDLNGRLVKTFIRDRVKSGGNRFSFSIAPLNPGIYFLQIRDGKELIADKKIVRQG